MAPNTQSTTLSPPFGQPIPNIPHAISVSLPKWNDVADHAAGEERVRSQFKGGYPRLNIASQLQQIFDICNQKFGITTTGCLLFATRDYATACVNFATMDRPGLTEADCSVKVLNFEMDVANAGVRTVTLFAFFMPLDRFSTGLFRHAGCCLSTRFADDLLPRIDRVVECQPGREIGPRRTLAGEQAIKTIKERMVLLLQRGRNDKEEERAKSSDIFLFPTGMAGHYEMTRVLQKLPGERTVVFGFLYDSTTRLHQWFGTETISYGLGNLAELDHFQAYLKSHPTAVKAVVTECPSNPLGHTPNFTRLAQLSNMYGFVLIVDETVAGFANVDCLGFADVVVTSLTKSFSGVANVMAGSVVLNPRSKFYSQLHIAMTASYPDTLYDADAQVLEENSRFFLQRSRIMNENTAHLVNLLSPMARDGASTVALQRLYHTSTNPESIQAYRDCMRAVTPDFTPGYGALFTLKFSCVPVAKAFYDALALCKGSSLGADVTLCLPFTVAVFSNNMAHVSQYGLVEEMVRCSIGIESIDILEKAFLDAMHAAVDAQNSLNKPVGP